MLMLLRGYEDLRHYVIEPEQLVGDTFIRDTIPGAPFLDPSSLFTFLFLYQRECHLDSFPSCRQILEKTVPSTHTTRDLYFDSIVIHHHPASSGYQA